MVSLDPHPEGQLREPGWEAAWGDGKRAVHVGNVADFNAQFATGLDERQRLEQRRHGHHYACLAMFYSPHPAIVVLPRHLDGAWLDVISRELEWDAVELHSAVAEEAWMSEAIASRPALLGRICGAGLAVIPWGRTADFERLGSQAPGAEPSPAALHAVRRFESKAGSSALFREIARDHPRIVVPAQERVDSPRRLARRLTQRAGRGETTVLKTEYGVGGSGTFMVTPRQLGAAGGAKALLRRLAAEGLPVRDGAVLVEDYVDGSGRLRDLTFDGVIGDDGAVHPVGVAEMRVEGTSYHGATVGPLVVPAGLADTAARFGCDVGRALASAGYRGWFDVDFVTDHGWRLAPTETNLRLTGPAIAFMIRSRLDRIHGEGHLVRTLDRLPLGARLPEEFLFDHVGQLRKLCSTVGATLIPTLPTTGFDPVPAMGVAIAARTPQSLDAAESLVRDANRALGDPFEQLLQKIESRPTTKRRLGSWTRRETTPQRLPRS